MGRFGAGQAIRRLEDNRFLTGHGVYTHDIVKPDMVHAAVLRSPHAHAEIRSIDVSPALDMPGVHSVLTGADLRRQGIGALPIGFLVPLADGSRMKPIPQPVLAQERVRHVGDGVALVVADTPDQARDACEAIEVDYAPLPAVGTSDAALADGAEVLWPDQAPGNVLFEWDLGDPSATEAAFAAAAHVVRLPLVNSRVAPTALEPRAAIGEYDGESGQWTLTTGSQGSHTLQGWISETLKISEDSLRVISPDVGGGFGMKLFAFPEQALVLLAAQATGRPVKWVGDRSESFLCDTHGRDHVSTAALALDADGQFLALHVETIANIGAYVSQYGGMIPTFAGTGMLPGVYAIPALHAQIRGVMTNTAPVDAYRGAGRPEAAYLIERLVDLAARELGLAPDVLRARNMIPEEAMPHKTSGGKTYDSGAFAALMAEAQSKADWDGYAARKAETEARGLLRGRGLAYYIEACAGGGGETATLSISETGKAEILIGTQSTGQGHETAYAQMTADALGLPIADITVRQGDTAVIASGGGTGGSRSIPVGGAAVDVANDAIIEKAGAIAAEMLDAGSSDAVTFDTGVFRTAGTNRTVTIAEIAAEALRRDPEGGGLRVSGRWGPKTGTYPNGCHIVEIELDPDTGDVRFDRYTIVDDVGVTLNPLLLEGQVVGGAVQGLGQAMMEHAVYEADSGQLLTGSFMDYALPRAIDLPRFDHATRNVPCQTNPLGIKGAGEAGTIGATPAVANAVFDALWPLGVRHLDMPFTPSRIRAAISKVQAQ